MISQANVPGFKPLDDLTGIEGLVRGRMIHVMGESGHGMSTLALQMVGAAQDATCLWLDCGLDFYPEWATACGVRYDDRDRFEHIWPESMEDMFKFMEIYAEAGVDIIVVDKPFLAVGWWEAMEAGGVDPIARLQEVCAKHHCVLICTESVRAGGRGFARFRYYSGLTLKIIRDERQKQPLVRFIKNCFATTQGDEARIPRPTLV